MVPSRWCHSYAIGSLSSTSSLGARSVTTCASCVVRTSTAGSRRGGGALRCSDIRVRGAIGPWWRKKRLGARRDGVWKNIADGFVGRAGGAWESGQGRGEGKKIPIRASFSYMCAVTVGTDVYSCEVRIHLLTPLGVGNNIHSYIRTKSIFICICALYTRQPYRKSKKTWLSPGTTLTTSHACELSIAR